MRRLVTSRRSLALVSAVAFQSLACDLALTGPLYPPEWDFFISTLNYFGHLEEGETNRLQLVAKVKGTGVNEAAECDNIRWSIQDESVATLRPGPSPREIDITGVTAGVTSVQVKALCHSEELGSSNLGMSLQVRVRPIPDVQIVWEVPADRQEVAEQDTLPCELPTFVTDPAGPYSIDAWWWFDRGSANERRAHCQLGLLRWRGGDTPVRLSPGEHTLTLEARSSYPIDVVVPAVYRLYAEETRIVIIHPRE